jgi:hypothetical protein
LGPAGGFDGLAVPVVVGPAAVPAAVRFTPATPEAVVAPRFFFMKYQIAAPTIASRTRSHSQPCPPPSSAAGGAGKLTIFTSVLLNLVSEALDSERGQAPPKTA